LKAKLIKEDVKVTAKVAVKEAVKEKIGAVKGPEGAVI
jgi:hypothetical protein